MGITTMVTAALKRIPWTSLAMNYGPEILRKLKEQIRLREEIEPEIAQLRDEAGERIRELENLLADQEKLLSQQQERIELLEQTCTTLQERVKLFRILFAAAAAGAAALLVLLLIR